MLNPYDDRCAPVNDHGRELAEPVHCVRSQATWHIEHEVNGSPDLTAATECLGVPCSQYGKRSAKGDSRVGTPSQESGRQGLEDLVGIAGVWKLVLHC